MKLFSKQHDGLALCRVLQARNDEMIWRGEQLEFALWSATLQRQCKNIFVRQSLLTTVVVFVVDDINKLNHCVWDDHHWRDVSNAVVVTDNNLHVTRHSSNRNKMFSLPSFWFRRSGFNIRKFHNGQQVVHKVIDSPKQQTSNRLYIAIHAGTRRVQSPLSTFLFCLAADPQPWRKRRKFRPNETHLFVSKFLALRVFLSTNCVARNIFT